MFSNVIRDTAFTASEAENYFQKHIFCVSNNFPHKDKTFISTLRAIVMPRIENLEQEAPVVLRFSRTSAFLEGLRADSGNDDSMAVLGLLKNTTAPIQNYNSIEVVQIDCTNDDSRGIFEMIKNNFANVFLGWKEVPKVELFYMKTRPVLCFVNEELRSTILIVGSLSIKMYHYLQCSITAFLPWFFPKDKPLTDRERRLIKSLAENTPDTYLACLQEFADDYDFRKIFIHDSLVGIELKFAGGLCKQLEKDIDNQEKEIRATMENLNLQIQNREKKNLQLTGMRMMLKNSDPEESEIMNYFLNNKSIRLLSVEGTSIAFAFKGYLEYYDEAEAETHINNERSYFYDFNNFILGKKEFKQVLSAIFLTKELKLRICAAYVVHIPGNLEGLSHYEFDSEFKGYMPNPHIHNYSCMGNMQKEVDELIVERSDYITAFQTCDVSARGVKFTDSVVMSGFAKELNRKGNRNGTCIELPDGQVVNVVGAYEWLEANKAEV